jgi:hypothetical protein
MSDIGLKLAFSDPETSAAFSRELETANLQNQQFRLATFDPKLNFDSDTLILVLKVAGPTAGAIAGFLGLSQAILKIIKKPAVTIEIDGKRVELHAQASIDDIKHLCEILDRSGK